MFRCHRLIRICCTHMIVAGGLIGCVDERASQRAWHEKIGWTYDCVLDAARSSDVRFSTAQLRIMAGEPDYVLQYGQFVDRARQRYHSPEQIHTELKKGLCRVFAKALSEDGDAVLSDDSLRLTVDDCQFWVYEENSNFASPMPSGSSVSLGYRCYVFIVKENVMGIAFFDRWQAIQSRK